MQKEYTPVSVTESIEQKKSSENHHLVYMRKVRPDGEKANPQTDEKSASSAARSRRYLLQKTAAKLLPDERIKHCSRSVAPMAEFVTVRVNGDTGKAFYHNLQQCESYACPLCAERRTLIDRRDLSIALAEAAKQGYFPLLVTMTLSHSRADKLDDIRAALAKAFDRVFSGSRWAKLKSEYQVKFKVKSWEVTCGKHGWHPHLHCLFFLEIELAGKWLEKFGDALRERWTDELRRLGHNASWAHGLDVRTADSDIADYIAKFGKEPTSGGNWGADSEMARSPVKRAHLDGLTPFELLAIAAGLNADDSRLRGVLGADESKWPDRAAALYVEYFRAFKGKPRLYWGGTWDGLGMDAALESFLEQNPPQTASIFDAVMVDKSSWFNVAGRWVDGKLGADLRAALLGVTEDKKPHVLVGWLAAHGVLAWVLPEYWEWSIDRVWVVPDMPGYVLSEIL